jgi:hypothetical protein
MRQDLDLQAGRTRLKEFSFKLDCQSASIAGLGQYFQDELQKALSRNRIDLNKGESIVIDVFCEIEVNK